jgi:dimethylhistidine N-methyltransferase
LRYVTIDISPSALEDSSETLLQDYPRLEVVALAAEYTQGLRWLESHDADAKLILWLGSNVGNFDRPDAAAFLSRVRATMQPEDRLLMGVDLRKPRTILEPAYDDAQGITAGFNFNLLRRINRELGGRFDLRQWQHRALWREDPGRVEMHLVSRMDQSIYVDVLDRTFTFKAGETIHTESSHKYSLHEIQSLAAAAEMRIQRQWLDARSWFSLNLLAPA